MRSRKYLRPGIRGKSILTCDKHHKTWFEGDDFERFGGKACEECILNADILINKKNNGN